MKILLPVRFIHSKRSAFTRLCKANNLRLDYGLNKPALGVLQDIFEARSYSDYFPFYQNVTLLDIGAHYGYFSLFASLNSGKESSIYAFEPDPGNYQALCSNIRKNSADNIHSFPFAIGASQQISKLYKGRSPNHSLVKNYTLASEDSYTEVHTRTLQQIIAENNIRHIDFLKMDCEGSEYTILESTPPEVFDMTDTISMEFHDLKDARYNGQFIIQVLRNYRFEIVRYSYDPSSMGLNYGRIIAVKY